MGGQIDLFAETQPSFLARPVVAYAHTQRFDGRVLVGPFSLALGFDSSQSRPSVVVLVAPTHATGPVLLRLPHCDLTKGVPWQAIDKVCAVGVGTDEAQLDGAITLAQVLHPSLWGLDPTSSAVSTWRWVDAVLEHEDGIEPRPPTRSHEQVLCDLWKEVAAEVRWVLDALPAAQRTIAERCGGDTPFWLVAAWSDLIDRFPHGSRERTHLTRFATTAPLPLLTMAITHDDGDALIETVVAGRSLIAFFARWPEVPRGVWRRVMREADAVPDLDPDEFRSSLCALAVIGTGRWPSSRDAWHSLAALAGSLLGWSAGVRGLDADRWSLVLRALWDPDSVGDAVTYRRLRDAAALVACLGGERGRGLSHVEVLCRMLSVGTGLSKPAPASTGNAAITLRKDAGRACIEIVDTPQFAAAWGRTFGNCLRSRAVGAGYLRRGTLLAVLSRQGAPVAMIALESHAAGDGRFRLKLVEAHGHGSAAIDEATARAIEQLLDQVAMQAVEAAS